MRRGTPHNGGTMTKKPEYKMKLDLLSLWPDQLQKVLDELGRLAAVRGAETEGIKASIELTADELPPLQQIRELIESYVRGNQVRVTGTVTLKQPLIKEDGRRTVAVITPMDSILFRDDDGDEGEDDGDE